jgi:hypothetical protein
MEENNEESKKFTSLCKTTLPKVQQYFEENKSKINIHYCNDYPFHNTCVNGRIKIAKWLISLEDIYGKINVHANNDLNLVYAIRHPNFFKWLITLEPTHQKFNIHISDDKLFKYACHKGYLKTAQYLESLKDTHGTINIPSTILETACNGGNINVVKWLISLEEEYGKFDIRYAFHNACYYNKPEIAKYLISLEPTHDPINIHNGDPDYSDDNDDLTFSEACEEKHYDIAEFLVSLEPTHGRIYFNDDYLFEQACSDNDVRLARLFAKINSKYMVETTDEVILSYHIVNVKNILENPNKFPGYYIDQKINDRCIVCYQTTSNIMVRLCSTIDNDHYYCPECIKMLKNLSNKEECLLCKEKPYVRVYKPIKTTNRKRKRDDDESSSEDKKIKND